MEPKLKISDTEIWVAVNAINSRITALEKYFIDILKEKETATNDRFASSKEAVNAALAAAKEAIAAAMTASEKAILKAEAAADKRAEASNEIRAAMMDQQKNFSDKIQTDFRFDAVNQKVEDSNKAVNKRIELLEQQNAVIVGKQQGIGLTFGIVAQIITAAGTIAAIVSTLFYLFTKKV